MKKTAIFLIIVLCFAFSSCSFLQGDSGKNDGKYTVYFDANEGSSVAPQKTGKLEKAPETSKESHIFCGWFLDKEFKNPVIYPMRVDKDMTLYAKWSKDTEQVKVDDAVIKFATDNAYSYKAEYDIIPNELDLKVLADQGYLLKIDVTYEVYYKKDYNVVFDLGYMGAPDHDVYIADINDKGEKLKNLPTSTDPKSESISTVISAENILKTPFFLQFFTYNTQNIVYFKNVVINYTCMK